MGEAASNDGQAHGGGALQTAKDLFAGAVGGVAQVLIGECFSGELPSVVGMELSERLRTRNFAVCALS
jgi:hypothetical protein